MGSHYLPFLNDHLIRNLSDIVIAYLSPDDFLYVLSIPSSQTRIHPSLISLVVDRCLDNGCSPGSLYQLFQQAPLRINSLTLRTTPDELSNLIWLGHRDSNRSRVGTYYDDDLYGLFN